VRERKREGEGGGEGEVRRKKYRDKGGERERGSDKQDGERWREEISREER